MTLTLPRRLNNGDDGDADNLMEILDALAEAFPVTDTNQSAISASKVTIPSGFAWPASTIPSSAVQAAALPSGASDITSDPQFSRAYDAGFTRKVYSSEWTAPSGGGYPCPIKDGALFPSNSNDRVYEITRNSGGGQDALWVSQITHTFAASDKPIHAVAKDARQAYVLCQGSSGNPHPSIKVINTGSTGGAATSWLSLGATYTSVYKITINRQGSYLYVLAKQSGDATWRRLLRIDTSTLAVSECDLGSNASNVVYDIAVISDRGTAAATLGTVCVLKYDATATYQVVERIAEAAGDVYGGAFPSSPSAPQYWSPSYTNPIGMCVYRGSLALVNANGSSVEVQVAAPYPSASVGTWRVVSSTAVATTVSYTVMSNPVSTTGASQNGLIVGSVCSDGDNVYALTNGGGIVCVNPLTGAKLVQACANPNAAISASNTYSQCGLAFTGKHMIGFFNTTSDGAGYMFSF